MTPPRIAIGTCRVLPEPDVDEGLLLEALRERGADPEMVAWDADPPADLTRYDLCILRSTWNYFEDPLRFREWLTAAAETCALWNPLEVALWNLDKCYLTELAKVGIPIIPTFWASQGSPLDLAREVESRGWTEFVIKPTISAGSFATCRFSLKEIAKATAYLEEGLPARDWMVQKYISAVETTGERAIVVIDDEISHSVRKSPRFTGDEELVSLALVPSPSERAFAERVLAEISSPILYGRVDIIPDSDGTLLLAELELLEPSLFLKQYPPALDRFADAILARVDR